jgi:hypothetical protein
MEIVMGPNTQDRRKIVLGLVSGLTVLAFGQVKTTSMGACIPPGILRLMESRGNLVSQRAGRVDM